MTDRITLDEKALDAAIDAVREPYPTTVFRDLDSEQLAEIHSILRERGYTLDAVSAAVLRRQAPSVSFNAIEAYLAALTSPTPEEQ